MLQGPVRLQAQKKYRDLTNYLYYRYFGGGGVLIIIIV